MINRDNVKLFASLAVLSGTMTINLIRDQVSSQKLIWTHFIGGYSPIDLSKSNQSVHGSFTFMLTHPAFVTTVWISSFKRKLFTTLLPDGSYNG